MELVELGNYEWVTKEFDETGEFWILTQLREMLVAHGIMESSVECKGIKVEWKQGKALEISLNLPVQS